MKLSFAIKLIIINLILATNLCWAQKRIVADMPTLSPSKVETVLEKIATSPKDLGSRLALVSSELQGETFQSPLDFLNESLALSKTSMTDFPLYQGFYKDYVDLSRRGGKGSDFTDIMIYGSEWIVDNIYRKNVIDLTDRYSESSTRRMKTLEYVSRHPEIFVELNDSATLEKMKAVEMGFRLHRIPHMKKEWIKRTNIKNDIREGDIIVFLTNENDWDYYSIGVITAANTYNKNKSDQIKIVLIDPNSGEVLEESGINDIFKKYGQQFYGWRWLRPGN